MIYDIHTSNKSFLRVSKQLRERGVKNNKFLLLLHDEELVGVNPHSENLTDEQKVRIYREVCKNKWYFIREIVLIPEAGGQTTYKANLGNIAQSYACSMNLNFMTILPRQTGKTIGIIIEHLWVMMFGSINCNIAYINKSGKDAIDNGARFKKLRECLPIWLREFVESKNDIDNATKRAIVGANRTINNELFIKGAANSADLADKLGRGSTLPIVYFDEWAFTKFNQIIYDALVPAWAKAALAAKANHVPYGLQFTTTPNNSDVEAGAFAYKIRNSACKFTVDFYDMTPEYMLEYIAKTCSQKIVLIEYNHIELELPEAWLESVTSLLSSQLKIRREIFLEWPTSTENSVFTAEQLDEVGKYIIEQPRQFIVINKYYKLNFYKPYNLFRNYILSCDVSGGTSKDNSVLTIIDPQTFQIIGDFVSSGIDIENFKRFIEVVMTEYFVRAILVIERNSYGKALLDYFAKSIDISERMYKDYAIRVAEKKIENGSTVKQKQKTLVYGVDTTNASRPLMMDLLFEIVNNEPEKFVSPNIFKDLRVLIYNKNDKVLAMDGEHDDSVMSYLITRYAIHYGQSFQSKFGIPKFPLSVADLNDYSTSRDKINRDMQYLFNKINTNNKNIMLAPPDRYFGDDLKVSESEKNNNKAISVTEPATIKTFDEKYLDYNNNTETNKKQRLNNFFNNINS